MKTFIFAEGYLEVPCLFLISDMNLAVGIYFEIISFVFIRWGNSFGIKRPLFIFQLNVCGGVNIVGCEAIEGKASAVCEGGKSLGGVSSKLEISENGRISLTYPGPRLDNGKLKWISSNFL